MVVRSYVLAKNTRHPKLNPTLRRGLASFFTGFLLWNIDNLACDKLTHLRQAVLEPHPFLWVLAPLTQFHALWHVGVVSVFRPPWEQRCLLIHLCHD